MVNICESLINVVTENKPKMLTGLNQKVSGQVQVLPFLPVADVEATGEEARPNPSMVFMRNVVSPYLSHQGKQTAR